MQHIDSSFTLLEKAVLDAICEMHFADQCALKAQLLTATVHSRENTGAGFFTRFDVQRSSLAPLDGEQLRNGPQAKVEGLQFGMGFILWLNQGYAECLEGYAYAESTVGIDLERNGFDVLRH